MWRRSCGETTAPKRAPWLEYSKSVGTKGSAVYGTKRVVTKKIITIIYNMMHHNTVLGLCDMHTYTQKTHTQTSASVHARTRTYTHAQE